MDSATEFLFGKCVHSLHSPLERPHQPTMDSVDQFSTSFANVQELIVSRMRLGPHWPLAELFKEKTEKDMKVIDSFIQPILEDALERETARKVAALDDYGKLKAQDVDEASSLLDYLVSVTDGELVS